MRKLDTIRILTFDIITDDRWEENIKELIETRVSKIEELLSDIDGISIKNDGIKRNDYKECECTQYICTFYVKKDTRKITWEDIQKIVNSVNPDNPIIFRFMNVLCF